MAKKILLMIMTVITAFTFIFSSFTAYAASEDSDEEYSERENGWYEDISAEKRFYYADYSVDAYRLDYYNDDSVLSPLKMWNFKNALTYSALFYCFHVMTSCAWYANISVSSLVRYVVSEAFRFDFLSDVSDMIGSNLQTLAGISPSGFSRGGFYPGFIMLLVLMLGSYVAYTGALKHETSKAVSAVIDFIMIFVLSASFIAYSPQIINKVNDFSKDISSSALLLGTKIVMPGMDEKPEGHISSILFGIQVYRPWLYLEFGTTDTDAIGEDKIMSYLEAGYGSDARYDLVESEVKNGNTIMTMRGAVSRLVMTVFITIINAIISFYVLLMMGSLIFSQLLFIIYVLFLPLSFLYSMIPGKSSNIKRVVEKLFGIILMRAGLVILAVVTFCISSMLWTLSAGYPVLVIGLLQLMVYVGVYYKRNDILGMIGLNGSESEQYAGRLARRPVMWVRHIAFMAKSKTTGSIRQAIHEDKAVRNANRQAKRDAKQRDKGSRNNTVQPALNAFSHSSGTAAESRSAPKAQRSSTSISAESRSAQKTQHDSTSHSAESRSTQKTQRENTNRNNTMQPASDVSSHSSVTATESRSAQKTQHDSTSHSAESRSAPKAQRSSTSLSAESRTKSGYEQLMAEIEAEQSRRDRASVAEKEKRKVLSDPITYLNVTSENRRRSNSYAHKNAEAERKAFHTPEADAKDSLQREIERVERRRNPERGISIKDYKMPDGDRQAVQRSIKDERKQEEKRERSSRQNTGRKNRKTRRKEMKQ
ncbi:MAG: hypothetical protein IJM37_10445 [Lachnospiraceae bacterium]|nr:hypothetical protein [Lachnospiraceae bacterium]